MSDFLRELFETYYKDEKKQTEIEQLSAFITLFEELGNIKDEVLLKSKIITIKTMLKNRKESLINGNKTE